MGFPCYMSVLYILMKVAGPRGEAKMTLCCHTLPAVPLCGLIIIQHQVFAGYSQLLPILVALVLQKDPLILLKRGGLELTMGKRGQKKGAELPPLYGQGAQMVPLS